MGYPPIDARHYSPRGTVRAEATILVNCRQSFFWSYFPLASQSLGPADSVCRSKFGHHPVIRLRATRIISEFNLDRPDAGQVPKRGVIVRCHHKGSKGCRRRPHAAQTG
jgi:hypothetical protein